MCRTVDAAHALLLTRDPLAGLRYSAPWVVTSLERGERVLIVSAGSAARPPVLEVVDSSGAHLAAGRIVLVPADSLRAGELPARIRAEVEAAQQAGFNALACLADESAMSSGVESSRSQQEQICAGVQAMAGQLPVRFLCLPGPVSRGSVATEFLDAHRHVVSEGWHAERIEDTFQFAGVLDEESIGPMQALLKAFGPTVTLDLTRVSTLAQPTIAAIRKAGVAHSLPPVKPATRGPSPGELRHLTDELIREVAVSELGLNEVLQRVVDLAISLWENVDGASITIVRDGRAITAVASHPWVDFLDRHQYEESEGPCLETASHMTPGQVADEATMRRRWPTFARSCASLGVRAVSAFGVNTADAHHARSTHGALNLYSFAGRATGQDEHDQAMFLASFAGAAIAAARGNERADQLTIALQSRDVIGQAKGILMQRYGLDEQAAFEVLRRTSSYLQTKIHQVADHVVAVRELPG